MCRQHAEYCTALACGRFRSFGPDRSFIVAARLCFICVAWFVRRVASSCLSDVSSSPLSTWMAWTCGGRGHGKVGKGLRLGPSSLCSLTRVPVVKLHGPHV